MQKTKEAIQEASRLLSEELIKEPAKKIWAKYLPQNISADTQVLSYRAIARAIAHNSSYRYGIDHEANHYKDRVRRAILGQSLTQDTLHLFAETFDFSEALVKQISEVLVSSQPQESLKSEFTTALRYEITTSFYDIFFDKNLTPYKLQCTLTVRSQQPELDGVWAAKTPDTKGISIIEGGRSVYNEERDMYHILFDYPLNESESTEISYLLTINKSTAKHVGFLSLYYERLRPTCFFRVNFDDPENAPVSLPFERHPDGGDMSVTHLKVHDGHASIYLPELSYERIIFRMSEAEFAGK